MTASGSRIAAIAQAHVPHEPDDGYCWDCFQPWPCDASVLAGMLTPDRLAAAITSLIHGKCCWEPVEDAAAILVALEAQP